MITLSSPAKLNWYLRVLDKRSDGYHNLDTIFQELDLGDHLHFTALDEPVCRIEGFTSDIPPQTNLIFRAWELLRDLLPGRVLGLHVVAEKKLPAGGGLGGGSSNAATTLKAVNSLFGLGITAAELEVIGANLGSDIPFFIRGGCAEGHGRGEIVSPIRHVSSFSLVLVFPAVRVSTADAYRMLSLIPRTCDPPILTETVAALRGSSPKTLAQLIHNDFEKVVEAYGWYRSSIHELKAAGCLRAFLCGSGSTIAGLAADEEHARQIVKDLHESCPYPVRQVNCRMLPSEL